VKADVEIVLTLVDIVRRVLVELKAYRGIGSETLCKEAFSALNLLEKEAAQVEGLGAHRADLLQKQILELKAQVREWEDREAAICPEDVSFEDRIRGLEKEVRRWERGRL